jgi:hypothetical protein
VTGGIIPLISAGWCGQVGRSFRAATGCMLPAMAAQKDGLGLACGVVAVSALPGAAFPAVPATLGDGMVIALAHLPGGAPPLRELPFDVMQTRAFAGAQAPYGGRRWGRGLEFLQIRQLLWWRAVAEMSHPFGIRPLIDGACRGQRRCERQQRQADRMSECSSGNITN